MKRTATARWNGSLKEGNGVISTASGVLDDTQYSFGTRFEDGQGTNPEELIGAAHVGYFSMVLSMILGQSDLTPESIDTKATVTLEQADGAFAVTKIHLDVTAKVPGASEDDFLQAANAANSGCPISKALKPAITMDAKLED